MKGLAHQLSTCNLEDINGKPCREILIKLKNINDFATEEMQLPMLLKLVSTIFHFFTQ